MRLGTRIGSHAWASVNVPDAVLVFIAGLAALFAIWALWQ